MTASVRGKVRSTGYQYADGVEGWSVEVPKERAHGMPFAEEGPTAVTLLIGGQRFKGTVRARAAVPVVWISPLVHDENGTRTSLAHVLRAQGIVRNQTLMLECDRDRIRIEPDGE